MVGQVKMKKYHLKNVTKSEQIKDILQEMLDSGEYAPGKKLPAESELRKTFNVSRNTVREALSNLVHEGRLSKQHGRGTFVTDKFINADMKKTNFIGLCYPLAEYNLDILKDAQERVLEAGKILVTYNVNEDLQDPLYEKRFLEKVKKENFQSVIVFSTPREPLNTVIYDRLRKNGIKVILISPNKTDMSEETFFCFDYKRSGISIAEKIASMGYKHVALVSANMPPSYQLLKSGIEEIMSKENMTLLDNIYADPHHLDNPKEIITLNPDFEKKVKTLPKNTAVIATQMELGWSVHSVLSESGLEIPEDIGICAFYNRIAKNNSPILSKLIIPFRTILMDAIHYAIDEDILAQDNIQKYYTVNFEPQGTLRKE